MPLNFITIRVWELQPWVNNALKCLQYTRYIAVSCCLLCEITLRIATYLFINYFEFIDSLLITHVQLFEYEFYNINPENEDHIL